MIRLALRMLLALMLGLAAPVLAQENPAPTPSTDQTRILVLATGHIPEAKLRLLSTAAHEDGRFSVDYRYLRSIPDGTSPTDMVAGYGMVIFDSVNAEEAEEEFADYARAVSAPVSDKARFIPIKQLANSPLRRGITDGQASRIHDYYYNGGAENLRRLIKYLAHDVLERGGAAPEPPIIFAETGIYHPDYAGIVFPSLRDFSAWRGGVDRKAAPVIGIAISRESLSSGEMQIADALVRNIEARGGVALAYYFPAQSERAQVELLRPDGQTAVDAIINTRPIHWSAKRAADFTALGVSVLQFLSYREGDQAKWESSNAGISSMGTPFFLTLPEIAGTIDPVIAAARNENRTLVPIPYQLDMVVGRAFKQAKLTRSANADKRVAMMFYNYPPGERSAGASFLNIPQSLDGTLERLGREGYRVEDHDETWFVANVEAMLRPHYRGEPYTASAARGSIAFLPVAHYRRWYDALPQNLRASIEAYWGPPEKTFSVVQIDGQPQFAIPRVITGNVMILPQPPRASRAEMESKIFHDQAVPISHHYLAVYFYTREEFGADAIIHFGTHGSQEWLPGKERGLSRYDAGNLAIGDTPVIYPFIMDDIGEALQARRRGRATMISHLTPPMTESGLHGELAALHDLMHQYRQLEGGAVRERTRNQLIQAVHKGRLDQDMGWAAADIETRFDIFLTELHAWLGQLGSEVQPLGLHSFGQLPERDHLASTIALMLGDDFAKHAETNGARYLDAVTQTIAPQHDLAALTQSTHYRLIEHFVMNGADLSMIAEPELRADLERGRKYLGGFTGIREYDALVDALAGRFVRPTTGGDPVRHPEALPTGGNLYGFDPSQMPTRAAWEAGREITEAMIADYHHKHGAYPDKLAFSLWAIEAMRHLGVIESQALAAMGARPVWNEAGYVTGVEIIPRAELGRPRVDVVLSITGLYRDTLPNLAQLLARAVEDVAALDESDNRLRANSLRLRKELIAEGVDAGEAAAISTLRVFSNESGTYGTGLAEATLASGAWKGESRLAQLYLARMGYAYGADDRVWSRDLRSINLYGRNLSGTDAAVFSRTSNLYGLLTSDDPFQYMGGLSLAVRHLDGTSPEMYIANLRDQKNMRAEPLGLFLSRELRTRQFHPQWIRAMQAEGYSGTLALVDSLNNFWGWQVVDPQNVRADQWQDFFEIYVKDRYNLGMRDWFEKSNPEALAQMLERMLEAKRHEYWNADDATVANMVETYRQLTRDHDIATTNAALAAFIDRESRRKQPVPPVPEAERGRVGKSAVGYGLGPRAAVVAQEAAAGRPRVRGQVLDQVAAAASPVLTAVGWLAAALAMLVPFLIGISSQIGLRRKTA